MNPLTEAQNIMLTLLEVYCIQHETGAWIGNSSDLAAIGGQNLLYYMSLGKYKLPLSKEARALLSALEEARKQYDEDLSTWQQSAELPSSPESEPFLQRARAVRTRLTKQGVTLAHPHLYQHKPRGELEISEAVELARELQLIPEKQGKSRQREAIAALEPADLDNLYQQEKDQFAASTERWQRHVDSFQELDQLFIISYASSQWLSISKNSALGNARSAY